MVILCRICQGLLIFSVIHIVVLAEDITVSEMSSIKPQDDSVHLNSKTGSEQVQIPALITTNKDIQNPEMKSSPQETVSNSSIPTKAENNTKPKTNKDELKSETGEDPMEQVYRVCKRNLPCVEKGLTALIDRLDATKSVPVFESHVTIEKTSEVPEKDVIADPTTALLSRIDRYFRCHSIRVRIPKLRGDVPELLGRLLEQRTVDFGLGSLATENYSEGRSKLRRILLPLIIFMELKLAVIVPIAISIVTILALKGLWAGLASLLVSGAVGLQALLASKEGGGIPSTRFSLGFSKPHIAPEIYHHGDYLSGWSRSPVEHPYRSDPYYRGEHPYRGENPYRAYYPSSWDRPIPAAAAAAAAK